MGNTAHCYPDYRYKQKISGAYNIKLCININGERRNYRTNINLTKDEWLKLNKQGLKDAKLITERDAIREIDISASKILKQLGLPTFEAFEYEYYNQSEDVSKDPFVSAWFDKYIAYLEVTNHPFTYCENLRTSKNSFLLFKNKLKFSHVTPEFLEKYRAWMESNEQKEATTQAYLRNLRTVFNYAIAKKAIHKDRYPFGNGKFTIGSSSARKKALSKSRVLNLLALNYPNDISKEHAKDIFIFQYLSNGMNLLDVCKLKQSNLEPDSDYFTFHRTKTRQTRKNGKPIRVHLQPESHRIIEKWGNKTKDKDDFIFPYFNAIKGKVNCSKDERYLSNLLTKKLNKYLKRIGKEMELPFDLTTGISRHSYASVLKSMGYSDVEIGDGMGHENTKTTSIYLDTLDDERVKEMSNDLL